MVTNKARTALQRAGLASGGLAKLRITYDQHGGGTGGPIEALFNPREISRSRSVWWDQQAVAGRGGNWTWSDMQQQFLSISAETLAIELFFDTYEPSRRAGASLAPPSPATAVTDHTEKVAQLATADRELHRPPVCHLDWGKFRIFDGVLTQLDQRFTMFLADGTPVRATLACNFTEYQTKAHAMAQEMHSADVAKTRVVRRHDTLHSLAAQEYDDASQWRHIARANGIVNPRDLRPGTVLMIPKLPT